MIVEDEEIQRVTLHDDLIESGYDTTAVESPRVAIDLVRKEPFDVILTDLKMPELDGITLLERVKKIQPHLTVIVMTAYGRVESAVKAMKLGAYDYLTKPFSSDELSLVLKRVDNYRTIVTENLHLRRQLETRYAFGNIIGKSSAMQEIYRQLEVVTPTATTVLLEGETGTGKEMAANAIHYNSPRKNGPFIKLSCAMLSKEILESELFGHERGAFTGALREKKGRFELAHGGSLFVDELDDIPVDLQVKLLRVLEEQTFERVGGTKTMAVDVRLIAATKKNLRNLVAQGKFREDLFYRLNIYPIRLPPLRNRKEDIPLLFEHFLREFSAKDLPQLPDVNSEAMAQLMDYSWPGNVRELRNVVERLTLSCRCNPILPECLPIEIRQDMNAVPNSNKLDGMIALDQSVEDFERELITAALAKSGGNKAKAAGLLKVPASTLKSKMKKYGIE